MDWTDINYSTKITLIIVSFSNQLVRKEIDGGVSELNKELNESFSVGLFNLYFPKYFNRFYNSRTLPFWQSVILIHNNHLNIDPCKLPESEIKEIVTVESKIEPQSLFRGSSAEGTFDVMTKD